MDLESNGTGRLGAPRRLVLGMDPGISSCGFALLDVANEEILEMGVRLFEAPVNPKTKVSLASVRRAHRSARRNIDRTQDRLKHVLSLLISEGVVPEGSDKEFFHTVAGDRPPLALRAEGLDRLLTHREWAMALYSIAKRRGHMPHGTGSSGADAEEGRVLKALGDNDQALSAGRFRTVGEYLASLPRSRNRAGSYDLCVRHSQLMDEVRTLFECQRSYGSDVAGESFENSYIEICDWERPSDKFDEVSYSKVGSCVYFPAERRAARCTLTSELVSAYAAIGNIRIIGRDGRERAIDADVRAHILGVLFSPHPLQRNVECKLTYKALRRQLDLPSFESFKGIDADAEKTREVFAPKGFRILRRTLDETMPALTERLLDDRDIADDVMEAVAYSSSERVLKARLAELDLSDGEIAALMGLPYSATALNGYGARSKKALDILLDSLMDPEVTSLTQAERDSGLLGMRLEGADIERSERLMPYESWLAATGRTNSNPVVMRAMAQMRKVVNAVCRKWGVPNEIHIELSRDLALPKRVRERIEKANRRNAKERERLRVEASEILNVPADAVSGKAIEKYRLHIEQGGFDIYTGAAIDLARMLKDDTYTQIDHVLPFSRTGDNSRHNKVLVLTSTNQAKREMTPYEWMAVSPGGPDWEEFRARVENRKQLSAKKRSMLLERDLGAKEAAFIERNLADTAYMSREVARYISDCLRFPDDGGSDHVVCVSGRATAWLRRQWGLNLGVAGEKDRADFRHHAVDGAVIAACNRSLVIRTAKAMKASHIESGRTARASERKAIRMRMLKDTMPWPTFADEVRVRREFVSPSRFVPRKGSGELFEQTTYSLVGYNDKGKALGLKKGALKPAVFGNAAISSDGKSLKPVGDMLCLRLWFDPKAKRRGGGFGRYYADPVYKADLHAIADGTYKPRIAKCGVGRSSWEIIPDEVLSTDPIVIHRGDVIEIDGVKARYEGFCISTACWSVRMLSTSSTGRLLPNIGSLGPDSSIRVCRDGILS